jgi:MFS transporter, DHA1 family, multidrug resistance protein
MSSPTAASPQPSPTVGIRGPHLLTLIALSAVSPLAINIVVPALPGLQRVFQADYATVQLALSLYLLTFALAQLIVGPLSDRYGRRPVILWGLVVFAFGSAMCVLAPSIEILIIGRVVQALGGSAGIVLARAIVRDLHERDRAAAVIGYMTTGMAMAQMVGPAVGGLLDEKVGWQAIFWLLTGASVIVFGVCLTDLRETNRYRGQSIGISALIKGYGTLLRHPVFVSHAATATFASAVYFAFMGGAPYIATELMGLTPSIYGLYFIFVAGGYAVGNFISGRRAQAYGIARMITLGNALALVSIALSAVLLAMGLMHPLSLFVPMFIASVANGITLPSAIAGAVSARPDLAGAASGLSGALQVGLGAVATAVVGATLSDSAAPMVATMGFFAVLAFITGLWARRHA